MVWAMGFIILSCFCLCCVLSRQKKHCIGLQIMLLPANDVPIITTSSGKVEGYWAKSFDGRHYASFEGIPFAEKPLGELKFADLFYAYVKQPC